MPGTTSDGGVCTEDCLFQGYDYRWCKADNSNGWTWGYCSISKTDYDLLNSRVRREGTHEYRLRMSCVHELHNISFSTASNETDDSLLSDAKSRKRKGQQIFSN